MQLLRQPVQEQERGRATPELAPCASPFMVVLCAVWVQSGVPRIDDASRRGRCMRLLRGGVPSLGTWSESRLTERRYPGETRHRPGLGRAHSTPARAAQVQRVQLLQEVLQGRPLSAASQAQSRRHQRQVDQHAGECLSDGGGPLPKVKKKKKKQKIEKILALDSCIRSAARRLVYEGLQHEKFRSTISV